MVSRVTVCINECLNTNENSDNRFVPRCLLVDVYHIAALSSFQEMMDDYTESNHDIMLGGHQGLTLDRWAWTALQRAINQKFRHIFSSKHFICMQRYIYPLRVETQGPLYYNYGVG